MKFLLAFSIFIYWGYTAYGADFYVDFSSGNDSNLGTSTSSPWKHCPGDPAASSIAATTVLIGGDTVFFKGGVSYVLSGPEFSGITLRSGSSLNNRVVYDGNSAGTWGAGKARITDNNTGAIHHGFDSQTGPHDITIRGFLFKDLGGSDTLPPDPGGNIPARQGVGIEMANPLRVTIEDCDFTELGYWFNQKPMGTCLEGNGVWMINARDVVIRGCNFSRVLNALTIGTETVTNNVVVDKCTFTDSIMWCIDIAARRDNASISGIEIKYCTFYDYYQFDQDYWQGYGEWPHTDGIFFRHDYEGVQTDGQ